MFRKRDTHIHFVGIGGIGMSGIAEILLNLGYRVSGTDLADTETTRRLQGLGAEVHRGHRSEAIEGADVVVASSAIRSDNPEVCAAREQKIPVIPRAEMLAELTRLKRGLLVAGSHGKTTTTSMVASVLHAAGLDPTVVIGGKVNRFDSNARLGYGELLVAEADESDGSFLVIPPTYAIITNIDAEHLEHYGTLDALLDAFVGFANRVPFYGLSIVCIDDPKVRSILPRLQKRTLTYGFDASADVRASEARFESGEDGGYSLFRVSVHGEDQGEFQVRMPGPHNVLNALATIALCIQQHVHPELIRSALRDFSGVQRRFTLKGEARGVRVVDDYAHHPTEIAATLRGAQAAYPQRRIVAAIQPHRFTRVRDHGEEFVRTCAEADVAVFCPTYAAGETAIPGCEGADLARRCAERMGPDRAFAVDDVEKLPARLAELVREGDLVLTLGAGSITRVGPALLERLE